MKLPISISKLITGNPEKKGNKEMEEVKDPNVPEKADEALTPPQDKSELAPRVPSEETKPLSETQRQEDPDSEDAVPTPIDPNDDNDGVEEVQPEAATPVADASFDALQLIKKVDVISSQIVAAKSEIEDLKNAVVGSFKETTDRMHEKIQKYDKGIEESLKKPLVDEIISICDEVEKNIRDVGDDAELALKKLRELPEVIKSSLYNLGIEEYAVIAGEEKFNPRRHRGIKPVPTDDEKLDGVIKDVFCTGYVTGAGTESERVYRTAWVSVYKKN